MCFYNSVDKRNPLKAIRTPKKEKKEQKYFLERTYATSEYKGLLGSDSVPYAMCYQFIGKPIKTGAYHNREKLNLGRSDLSDPPNNIFGSPARPVPLISGPKPEKKIQPKTITERPVISCGLLFRLKENSRLPQVPVKGETIILFLDETHRTIGKKKIDNCVYAPSDH